MSLKRQKVMEIKGLRIDPNINTIDPNIGINIDWCFITT